MGGRGWANLPERFALANVYHEVAAVIGWDMAVDLGMYVWQNKRPPSRFYTDAIHGGGVGVMYIPATLTGRNGRELVELLGQESAEKLVAHFAGASLRFPCVVSASIGRRNKAIAACVARGDRIAVVACLFDLTERQVRRIAQQEASSHVS